MVKRNAHTFASAASCFELAHYEIRVGYIPRRIHCVSPDRLLLRFFCQRVLSESSRTPLRENLIALVNTYRDESDGRARGSSPAEKRAQSLYHKGTRNSPPCRNAVALADAPRAAELRRCTVLRHSGSSAEQRAGSAFPGVPARDGPGARARIRFDPRAYRNRAIFHAASPLPGGSRRLSRPPSSQRGPSTCSGG